MFKKNKDRAKIDKFASEFSRDYKEILGVKSVQENKENNNQSEIPNENFNNTPTGWIDDLLPKVITKNIGEFPEKVYILLASKELTQDEKKVFRSFFDVDEETAKRRILILEKLINEYMPDIASIAHKIKDDPHFQLLMEMISPIPKLAQAKAYINEQRQAKEFMDSKGVDV